MAIVQHRSRWDPHRRECAGPDLPAALSKDVAVISLPPSALRESRQSRGRDAPGSPPDAKPAVAVEDLPHRETAVP